ncbi:MAG: MalY/PatB family protein [Ilumatobacteraceae bacterium]
MSDLFGLRSLDPAMLASTPGVKWQAHPGRLAAWVADMDFPIAPAISERLSALVARGALGYPNWGPTPSPAGRLFVERMNSRWGWSPDIERVHDVADVLQGVRIAIELLTEPGDPIALHTPAYHPFLNSLREMDRRVVELPVGADRLDEVESIIAAQRPRLLILCHPHNPTGHRFRRCELERLAEIAEAAELVVVSDEIHSDLVYDDPSDAETHVPFASVSEWAARRTVTVTSASKAFNLAGLRWAVMHVGHAELERRLRSFPDHFFGAPNLIAVEAAVAAWTDGGDWLSAVMGVLDENRRSLADLLGRHLPGARYTPPEATYLAWIDCSHLGEGEAPRDIFRERGVEVSPGPQFGREGSGHVRLNMATSPFMLERIVAAMGGT